MGTASKDATWLYYPTSGVNTSLITDKDHWTGCVIDRSQSQDADASAPIVGNTNTLYPAVKCAQSGLRSCCR